MPRSAARTARLVAPPPVSIAAVAERAGVSIATVSRVVNGVAKKASAQTVERVREAIDALGYRPMGAGRSLRNKRSRLVAVLAANLANPSMAAIAAVAEVALRRAGQVMVLCDTHDLPELQDEYLLEMRAQYACGFVLLGAVKSPVLEAFVASGEPLVFVNRRNPFGERCHVGIDNRLAGADVARWLSAAQRLDVALIHGRLWSSATAERVEGFCIEWQQLGHRLPKARIATRQGLDHLEIGYQAMHKLIASRHRPQAVFCTSDLIAYGAQRAASEAGLSPDRDVTFVGFDDSPLNAWVAPWLNAVRVPYADYGEAIVRALQSGATDTVLAHQLVVRPPLSDQLLAPTEN
jgi:LacI family transcriptional regulator